MERFRVVVIGGGFSGLGVGAALLRAGIDDFVIVDKGDSLGGTWRDNTYPGCACDVPSQLYSFSFAPNPGWSRVFAPAAEIQRYLLAVARSTGVERHARLGVEVLEACWLEAEAVWAVTTSQGTLHAEVLVSGAGPLHTPSLPAVEGLDTFEGTVFHSARWDHDHDLTGRRVAVVGTGSSAIQLVPEIQPVVGHLTLMQRTPGWVLPKPDHAIPAVEEAAFRHVPGFAKAYRGAWYAALELLQLAERRPAVMERLQGLAMAHLRLQVPDAELRARLTPDWVLGCKRLLLSNTYYPALTRDNVTVTGAIQRVTPTGVVDADGAEHPVDTVVFATGFEVSDPPIAHRLRGRDGRTLAEHWQGSPEAFLGTTVPGFPNLFLMLGPNLGNGHTSALVIVEAQARHIVGALQHMAHEGISALEVKAPAHADWNASVQAALQGTVWNAGGCASWYLDATGRNSAIYPWTTIDLRRRLQTFRPAFFEARRREVVVVTGGARGIGRAVAEAFVARGSRVCIGDVDEVAARRTAETLGCWAHPLDVTDDASFEAFLDAVRRQVGEVDVLVNNAGVLVAGGLLDVPAAAHEATMAVNYGGTLRGLQLVLPAMVARGSGHVVNVVSLGGRVAVPGMATYVASKHAALALSASVRRELEGTGVSLTAVLPTAVRTRLAAGVAHDNLSAVDPEDVAGAVVGSVTRPEAEIVVPRHLDWPSRAQALLPARLHDRLGDLLGAKRMLHDRDVAARAEYEARVVAQVAREAS